MLAAKMKREKEIKEQERGGGLKGKKGKREGIGENYSINDI